MDVKNGQSNMARYGHRKWDVGVLISCFQGDKVIWILKKETKDRIAPT